MLYSRNVFCFDDEMTTIFFAQTILPHRLDRIKAIEVNWLFKDMMRFPYETAKLAYDIVASMRSLREMLVVAPYGPGDPLVEHHRAFVQNLFRDMTAVNVTVTEAYPWVGLGVTAL